MIQITEDVPLLSHTMLGVGMGTETRCYMYQIIKYCSIDNLQGYFFYIFYCLAVFYYHDVAPSPVAEGGSLRLTDVCVPHSYQT